MARQEKRYCRGCKCTTDASQFISLGKQYKQCTRCRERIVDRKRSEATVVCGCGREVLKTSLRDHLRTLYHEEHMVEKAPVHKTEMAEDVARPPIQKPIPMPKPTISQQLKPAVIQQLKPAVLQQPKLVHTSAPINPPRPVTFVFRKAQVAAPATSESLQRTKPKQGQTTTAHQQ